MHIRDQVAASEAKKSKDKPARTENTLTQEERGALVVNVMNSLEKLGRKAATDFAMPHLCDDMEGEALAAGVEAARYFDPSKGVKFLTFAAHWASRVLLRKLHDEKFDRLPEVKFAEMPDHLGAAFDPVDPASARGKSGADDDEPDAGAEAFADLFGEAFQADHAERMLAKLTPGFRSLVEDVIVHGLRPAQIAEQRGLKVNVVRTNLQAAIAQLTGKPFPAELTANPERIAANRAKRDADPAYQAKQEQIRLNREDKERKAAAKKARAAVAEEKRKAKGPDRLAREARQAERRKAKRAELAVARPAKMKLVWAERCRKNDQAALAFVGEVLAAGKKSVRDMRAEAESRGIAWASVRRAATQHGVPRGRGVRFLELPAPGEPPAATA